MKKQVFAFAIMMAAFGSANAQLEASTSALGRSAVARAEVYAPIDIKKSTDLEYGIIVVKNDQGGTITVAADAEGKATVKDGVMQWIKPGAVNAASFAVTGQANESFSIKVDKEIELIHKDDASATMKSTLMANADKGTLDGDGKASIYVGGTLTVNAKQKPGQYESKPFDVTVAYE